MPHSVRRDSSSSARVIYPDALLRSLRRRLHLSALAAFALLATARAPAQGFDFRTLAVPGPAQVNSGIAVDAAGHAFLADSAENIIRRLAPDGTVTPFAGRPGVSGNADGPAATALFRSPRVLAVGPAGELYVADDGNGRLRRISPAGVVTTIPIDASSPVALAVDAAGNLYYAESTFRRIRKITAAGVETNFAGQLSTTPASVDGPAETARFREPMGLAVDRAGQVYVADFPSTVRQITPAGLVSTLAGSPHAIGSADGRGAAARFNGVNAVAVDATGHLFVTDSANATLRRIAPDGTVTTLAGQPGQPGAADGIGGAARFRSPHGVALDPAGSVFVTESGSAAVRRGDPYAGPLPPLVHTPPRAGETSAVHAGANTTIVFTAAATGTAPLAYQWLKDGRPLPGAVAPALTLSAVGEADEGSYTLAVSNAVGAVTSLPLRLTVFTPSLTSFVPRREVPGGSFLWGVAAGPGQLVAVGTGGTILSSADGRTWTRRSSGTAEWLVGVTYGAARFVVVGDRGTILTSLDGIAWTPARASATTRRLNNVTYAANTFVAVGEGGAIVTSPDADTWTLRESGVSTWLRGLVYKALSGTLPSYQPPSGPGVSFSTIAWTGDRTFYASGQDGVLLASADNGVTWRPANTPPVSSAPRAPDLEALGDGPVGIGEDGAIIHQRLVSHVISYSSKSPLNPGSPLTGVNYVQHVLAVWDRASIGINARFRGIARGNGLFVMGENGAIAAAPDVNGPWATLPSGTRANLVSAAFHGDTLFIVGENETILESAPLLPSRLTNLSTRGLIPAPTSPMISGFVVAGSAPKQVLIRAAGPALVAFGVADALTTPALTLFDSAGRSIASNAGWSLDSDPSAVAAARVGAFPFAPNSADAALLVTLPPGSYTTHVSTRAAPGVALLEVYDADAPVTTGPRAINLSTRGTVGPAGDKLIAGFTLAGADSRRVLLRAVGPSLDAFGVPGALAAPQLELYNHRGILLSTVRAWSAAPESDAIRAAAITAGAFPLFEGSNDAAFVTTLPPGSYTAQVGGVNNTSGAALVEVYELP